MSKRKADDILSCCPASKRFISLCVDCKSVNPLLSRERTKRKLHEAQLGPQPDYKRVESGDQGTVVPQERRDTHTSSRRHTGSALTAAQPPNVPRDEVSSQYNSFQFWRVPLPKIELAEIEGIGDMKIIEEMNCDIPEEATEMEMELQN